MDTLFLKDHLGSNRVVVTPAGTAMQVNHYYPFGGLFGESTGGTSQRFKYNGKEFDRTHGVDWYDYGARHMTPDAGRFTTIDPMAEKYYNISPYAYCTDNPINAIDTEGKWVWPLVNAAIDYGFQVYDNYNAGMSTYDVLVGNVNFAKVGMSAIPLGKDYSKHGKKK
ncbi:MAG: RHS repeat-associated core domain-containing protein [Prevotella sp.]|nr:RHS repeat-associated core domain-containing protein [Prevotella sp.]